MTETLILFAIRFINILIQLMYWAILIYVLMSWFARGASPLGSLLAQIVRPILTPFRWARIGMIDLSPIVALIALDFLGRFLIQMLQKLLA